MLVNYTVTQKLAKSKGLRNFVLSFQMMQLGKKSSEKRKASSTNEPPSKRKRLSEGTVTKKEKNSTASKKESKKNTLKFTSKSSPKKKTKSDPDDDIALSVLKNKNPSKQSLVKKGKSLADLKKELKKEDKKIKKVSSFQNSLAKLDIKSLRITIYCAHVIFCMVRF